MLHQPLTDMTSLAKPPTSLKLNQSLTGQTVTHLLEEITQLLSQRKTSLVDLPEILELSEEENTYSLLFLAMVQEYKLMEIEFSITGVNTD
jgi:hypothetical protein